MRKQWKRRLFVGLLAIVAAGGCNPLTMLYFLTGAPEGKLPPEVPLKTEKKEARVLVLTSASPGLAISREDSYFPVDRTLHTEFVQALTKGAEANKEKITVISNRQLEKYKDQDPNWQARDPAEIGAKLGADFVINLEVNELRLYYPGSNKSLLQGYTKITGMVFDLTKPDSEPKELNEYTLSYPRGYPIQADGGESTSKFRQQFIRQIALELSWKFTAHQIRDKVSEANRLLD